MPTEEELAAQKAAEEAEMAAALELPVEEAASEKVDAEPEKEETPTEEKPVEEKAAEKFEEKAEEKKPEEQKEPTEAERLAAENARLREELNEQARRLGTAEKPPVEVKPPGEVKAPATVSPLEFITAEEAEALIDKPHEVLNAILNKVFQAGREATMREMPTLVKQQAATEIALQARVQKFWADNKDLEPYRDFCAMVANQVEIENPGMPFNEVLEKTGDAARERLKLPKQEVKPAEAEEEVKEPSKKPALPASPGSARKPAPKRVELDTQAMEMEAILEH